MEGEALEARVAAYLLRSLSDPSACPRSLRGETLARSLLFVAAAWFPVGQCRNVMCPGTSMPDNTGKTSFLQQNSFDVACFYFRISV